jgi:hypothetical protein
MQIFRDRLLKFRTTPVAVQVFDAKNQFTTGLLGAFLRTPKRYGVPEVEITRG